MLNIYKNNLNFTTKKESLILYYTTPLNLKRFSFFLKQSSNLCNSLDRINKNK